MNGNEQVGQRDGYLPRPELCESTPPPSPVCRGTESFNERFGLR